MNYNFSIIIIGYNSLSTLKKLLSSIKQLNADNIILEIIYVDDGSTDGSYDYFQSYKLPFKIIPVKLATNHGRAYATNKGIQSANGDWFLLIQSNMTVRPNLLQHYAKAIFTNNALIFTGTIQYKSTDIVFQNYLNHKNRGINAYKKFEKVHYSHLLFGNCIIHKSIFQEIKLNLKLDAYGGEELDFAYRALQKFPNAIIAYPKAQVVRIQFPILTTHCLRLEEYGHKNLKLLSPFLQKQVVKFPQLFFNIPFYLRWLISVLYCLGKKIYTIPYFSRSIIRLVLGLAILKGYYNKAK